MKPPPDRFWLGCLGVMIFVTLASMTSLMEELAATIREIEATLR